MATTLGFLPEKSHGQRSLAGYIGSQRVGNDLVTKQQQKQDNNNDNQHSDENELCGDIKPNMNEIFYSILQNNRIGMAWRIETKVF